MSTKITLNLPVNRVEGDLEVKVEIVDGRCTEAWCTGTMFRGFERLLVGRGALDGLVITPRICGICSTAHLMASVKALEDVVGVTPPAKAVALRNVALMTEHLQSDVRQSLLTFAPDLAHEAYRGQPLFDEARRRYAPFEGSSYIDVIRESKKVVEVVALLGGQWPHSSFMVPGGIASVPTDADLLQCQLLLERYRRWYEQRVLGCELGRWAEVVSASGLDAWLDEAPSHSESEVGFLVRHGRAIGLDQVGVGTGSFLTYGALDLPEGSAVTGRQPGPHLIPGGFFDGKERRDFDQQLVGEDIAHSWFEGAEGSVHPSRGETTPYATGGEGRAYSWAKAPRYDERTAETGPLAEALLSGDALFTDLVERRGSSALVRQLARLVRPASLLPAMQTWLKEALTPGRSYVPPGELSSGEGIGLTHASRGALGHWVRLADGRIDHYQIITPTAWNASPRDAHDMTGPIETALVGTAIRDADDPVELGHVIRSFDPCLVCTVHAVRA